MIATLALMQAAGGGIVTLADNTIVARIPAGETFTPDAFDMDVPNKCHLMVLST